MLIAPIQTALAGEKKKKRRIENGRQWGVRIQVLDLYVVFEIYFLANNMLLDGFHAKELIF